MAELVQCVISRKVIAKIETANGNQRISEVNQQTNVENVLLPRSYESTGKHKRYVLAVEDVDQCNCITVNAPQQSSPFYPMSRESLDRGQAALEFIDELFDLGRRVRRRESKNRERARRMLYDWAMSLSIAQGLSRLHAQPATSTMTMMLGVPGITTSSHLPKPVQTPPGLRWTPRAPYMPVGKSDIISIRHSATTSRVCPSSDIGDQEVFSCLASISSRTAICHYTWRTSISVRWP